MGITVQGEGSSEALSSGGAGLSAPVRGDVV
jgi:hypothetical protein